MKKNNILAGLSLAVLLTTLPLQAGIVLDPQLVTGTNAIDPLVSSGTGIQTVDQTAPGSLSQAALEALAELGAVQDFANWGNQSAPSYIIFTDERRADVKGTYENLTGSTAGGPTASASQQTSDGKGIKINSGSLKSTALVLDFGSATVTGTGVAFDPAVKAPSAAGLTISGLGNVSTNVKVTFFGHDDSTPLFTGTVAKYPVNQDQDPNAADGDLYGSDGYVGYQVTGTWTGIGKIRVETNQVIGSSAGIGIDDLAYTPSGKAYYMSPTGSGNFSGSNPANALAQSQMETTLNTTMKAGETLYLASGSYNTPIVVRSSGSLGKPKRVVGLGTGANRTIFAGQTPGGGTASFLKISGTKSGVSTASSYWEFHSLDISKVGVAVNGERPTPGLNHQHLLFRDIQISEPSIGMRFQHCDNVTVQNCSAKKYVKNGFRVDYGCDTVGFSDCLANLTGNDPDDEVDVQYGVAESIPYGFLSAATAESSVLLEKNTNLTFTNCVAKNNRDYNPSNTQYLNGDGFDTEDKTEGVIFRNCISINNDDAGFDCKQASGSTIQYINCKAIRNSNNFKSWFGTHKYTNCVAVYCKRRQDREGTPIVPLQNDVAGFSGKLANIELLYCTTFANSEESAATAAGLRLYGAGTMTATDSVIAFRNDAGIFGEAKKDDKTGTIGTVIFVSSTNCRPSLPGYPSNFNEDRRTWNGIGTDMDTTTYGLNEGYNSTRP